MKEPLRPLVMAAAIAAASPTTLAQTDATAALAEWPVYGGSALSQFYSPLDQIDAANVGELRIAWRWYAGNFGPRPEIKNETTPLMIDGVLYATAGTTRNVVAIDAASGETLWIWRPDEGERFDDSPRKMSGRGVAYWTDGEGDERIFTATPGFFLVALDADTGLPKREFGEAGIVDMMQWLRGPADNIEITSTSPPLVLDDVVIVGPAHGVGARPDSKEQTKGDIRGFDARTGELLWTFHTIPEPGEFGYDTWLNDSALYTGNAGVWGPLSGDPELGIVYLPVEMPTSDMYGGERPKRPAAVHDRQRRGQADGLDLGQRRRARQPLGQRIVEATGALFRGLELPGQYPPVDVRMVDQGRQHVAGVVSRIDGHETHEAPHQQACPDEEHQGQRDLRHGQRRPDPVRGEEPEPAGRVRASFAEGAHEGQPRP